MEELQSGMAARMEAPSLGRSSGHGLVGAAGSSAAGSTSVQVGQVNLECLIRDVARRQ